MMHATESMQCILAGVQHSADEPVFRPLHCCNDAGGIILFVGCLCSHPSICAYMEKFVNQVSRKTLQGISPNLQLLRTGLVTKMN